MMATKDGTGITTIIPCSDYTIYKYDKCDCAINLKNIVKILYSAWTF